MAPTDPVRIEEISAAIVTQIANGVIAAGVAQPGDEMDLITALNPLAVTAIQAGLAQPGDQMALTAAAIAAVQAGLATAAALAVVNGYAAKIDNATTDGLLGVEDSIAYMTGELERHFHNRGRFWGATGAPTETNAIAATVTVPFVAVSGNNTWGAAIPICGTGDNPVLATDVKLDPHLILVTDTDHATPYRIRVIYGTGTSAAAIAAGQWSETMFITATGPFSSGVPVEILMRRVDVGSKLWVQVWNATNGSNVDFFWGAHGYAG